MDSQERVTLYSKENIDKLEWPEDKNGTYARKYLFPMMKNGVKDYISNIETELMILKVDDIVLPVTINDEEYENAYVCSQYTHYITYSLEEIHKLKSLSIEILAKILLSLIGFFFKLVKINKIVCVNNWMLSTNLYPQLTYEQMNLVRTLLLKKFKHHTIVFRSINNLTTSKIFKYFFDSGYLLIGSRSSYIYYPNEKHRSNEKCIIQRDKKLMQNSYHQWESNVNKLSNNTIRLKELYDQLYLNKYSECNPKFTEKFINLCLKESLLNIQVLSRNGTMYGATGFFEREKVITSPIFGYDLSIPQKEGIYRMLSLKLIEESEKQNYTLHMSSGAGEFKKCRGAKNVIEYSAVFVRHLPFRRRVVWVVLQKIVNIFAIPMIVKKRL